MTLQSPPPLPNRVILTQANALGDSVMLSAVARALIERGYVVDCQTKYGSFYGENPHLTQLSVRETEIVNVPFNLFHVSEKERKHLVQCAVEYFGITDIVDTKPWLFLSEKEKIRPMKERYAIVVRSCSAWWPTKHYPWWQAVVDATPDIKWVQMGDHLSNDALHTKLNCTIDKRGRIPLRNLMRWVAHADFVCCGITGYLHLAAAFDVPCICVAGGRELPTTFAYPTTNVLSNIGQYDCCKETGCFLRECVFEGNYARCKEDISPMAVVEAIRSL